MEYFVKNLGRKGTLITFVFISVCAVAFCPMDADRFKLFTDFAMVVVGIFSGANVFEHFAKKGK